MVSLLVFALIQVAALAYALVGGVFLAFSDFIMRALARTEGSGGIQAMQAINREVFRWVFMTLFIGLAAVSATLVATGWLRVAGTPGSLMVAAGLLYLVACFGVTIGINVPMNDALAAMPARCAKTRDYWMATYVPRWTAWNTVRAAACTVSALLLLAALPQLGAPG